MTATAVSTDVAAATPGQVVGPKRSSRSRRYNPVRLLVQLVSVVATLVGWQLIAAAFFPSSELPTPLEILSSFSSYVNNGSAGTDLATSGRELLFGYLAGVIIGPLLGLAIGTLRWLDAALSAQLTFFYSMPIVALAPLMVVWLGIGLRSKEAVVFLLTFFPVVINTRAGVRSVDVELLRVARSFGAGPIKILRTIVLPATAPFILTGMRLGVAAGVVGVFVGELVAAQHGVGYMMQAASASLDTKRVFVGLLIFGCTGVILTSGLGLVERYFSRWRPKS